MSVVRLIEQLEDVYDLDDDLNIFVDDNLENLKCECKDLLGNQHYLNINFEKNGKFHIKDHSLPKVVDLSRQFKDIKSAVQTFKEYIIEFNEYFEIMAELDRSCWVIDPINPTSKDNFRRIVLGSNVSIIITIDCLNAQDIPNVTALGPSALVEPLAHKIHQFYDNWDPNRSVVVNLLNMLGLPKFPSKPNILENPTLTEDCEIECGICLSSRDASGALPNILCEKPSCRVNYHNQCLYQWFTSLAGNVKLLNSLHGECPSCSTVISCPLDTVL